LTKLIAQMAAASVAAYTFGTLIASFLLGNMFGDFK